MAITLAAKDWSLTANADVLNSRDPDGDGVNEGIDTTAPTVSTPTHTVTGSTTADVGATSSEKGTMYAVAVASGATAPSGAQVKAGTDGDDTAAVASGKKSCEAAAAVEMSMSGLSASTGYDYYVTAEDEDGNLQSTPVTDSFTTDASGEVEVANILWNGDFEDGDFLQYPKLNDPTEPEFQPITDAYEPPPDFGGVGDGSECNLVTAAGTGATDAGPVRTGTYSVVHRLPVSGGSTTDPQSGSTNRLRTEIHNLYATDQIEPIKIDQTSWVALSVYVDGNWDSATRSGWGIIVAQMKPRSDSATTFELLLRNGSWEIKHKWYPNADPLQGEIDWWYVQLYRDDTPAADGSDSYADLLDDFPAVAAAQSALGDLNKGGWTDWIFKIRPDPTSSSGGGSGLLQAWKRNAGSAWVQILDVAPKSITIGGNTYDRGVFLDTTQDVFYYRQGLYTSATQVSQASADREIHHGGTRMYSGDSTFDGIVADMWGS